MRYTLYVWVRVKGTGTRHKTQQVHVTSGAPGDNLRGLPKTKAGAVVVVPARAVATVAVE